MLEKDITINIPENRDARLVAVLVQLASQYESRVYVELEEKKVNAKSIMGMMSIGLSQGSKVRLSADGTDEKDAVNNIEKYLIGQEA